MQVPKKTQREISVVKKKKVGSTAGRTGFEVPKAFRGEGVSHWEIKDWNVWHVTAGQLDGASHAIFKLTETRLWKIGIWQVMEDPYVWKRRTVLAKNQTALFGVGSTW